MIDARGRRHSSLTSEIRYCGCARAARPCAAAWTGADDATRFRRSARSEGARRDGIFRAAVTSAFGFGATWRPLSPTGRAASPTTRRRSDGRFRAAVGDRRHEQPATDRRERAAAPISGRRPARKCSPGKSGAAAARRFPRWCGPRICAASRSFPITCRAIASSRSSTRFSTCRRAAIARPRRRNSEIHRRRPAGDLPSRRRRRRARARGERARRRAGDAGRARARGRRRTARRRSGSSSRCTTARSSTAISAPPTASISR